MDVWNVEVKLNIDLTDMFHNKYLHYVFALFAPLHSFSSMWTYRIVVR